MWGLGSWRASGYYSESAKMAVKGHLHVWDPIVVALKGEWGERIQHLCRV